MSVYVVEGSKTRHLEPTCKALRAEVTEQHPELVDQPVEALDAAVEMCRKRNTGRLREGTSRCAAAGCWSQYVLDERNVATGGAPQHPGFPKPKDEAYHAASVLNDGTANHKRAAAKLAAKKGIRLEEVAQPALERQKRASS